MEDAYRGSKVPVLANPSVYKGKGSFGSLAEGTITLLESSQNTSLDEAGGLEVGRKYAIKLMKRDETWGQWYDEIIKEFQSMKKTYKAAPNLFLRPHLLLRKDTDSLAIVMELGGKSLNDYLGEREAPFTIEDLKRHVGDLAVAIATIHSLGCIHQDLKPENILLVNNGDQLQLKLIDLGLMAETKQGDDNPLLCCATDNAGSLIWWQPESVRRTVKTRGRAFDWWAFGLIILQLLGYFGIGKDAQLYLTSRDITSKMFPKIRQHYYEIFSASNREGELTEQIASECSFYNESLGDREDLLKFAFYFLDPVSRTRPFLRLEGDTKTEGFETREGEKARELQGLVNKLFPKFRVEAVPGAVPRAVPVAVSSDELLRE